MNSSASPNSARRDRRTKQQLLDEMAQLQKKIAQTTEELTETRGKLEIANADLSQVTEQCQKAAANEREIERINNHYHKVSNEQQSLQAENEKLKTENQQLHAKLAKIEVPQARNKEKASDIRKLEAENKTLKHKLKNYMQVFGPSPASTAPPQSSIEYYRLEVMPLENNDYRIVLTNSRTGKQSLINGFSGDEISRVLKKSLPQADENHIHKKPSKPTPVSPAELQKAQNLHFQFHPTIKQQDTVFEKAVNLIPNQDFMLTSKLQLQTAPVGSNLDINNKFFLISVILENIKNHEHLAEKRITTEIHPNQRAYSSNVKIPGLASGHYLLKMYASLPHLREQQKYQMQIDVAK